MVHCRPDIEACRSARIAGSATLTMEMSMTTTIMLVQQIARIRRRWRWLRSPAVVSGGVGELMIDDARI
ncbi:hypothetical protein GCM10023191_099230 [Actinoallomurus oryzae]|uniref:Uncharacterized protein n=1 Tax=Actinoallomurus oryzae TaxID=502180 RepID=A0ABP8R9H1_9ACTN